MIRLLHRHALPTMAAGMLLTALPLFAQTGDKPITLRAKYKQGEISKYQTTMAITMAPPAGATQTPQAGAAPLQQFSVLQQFQTSKVLPDGDAQVLVTTQNMQGGMGMGTTPLPKPVTLTMTPMGMVKSVKGNLGGNVPTMFSNMLGSNALGTQQLPLPSNAIKPGSSWSTTLPMAGMGTGSLKGQYVKLNTVGKQKTALLHYVLSIPINTMIDANMQPTTSAAAATMTMSGNLVMNVDNDIELQSGRLIRSTGTGVMAMAITVKNPPKSAPSKPGSPAKPGSMKVNTNLTLGTTLVAYTPPGAGGAPSKTPTKSAAVTSTPAAH